MKRKKLIAYIVEIVFYLAILAFLLFIKNIYANSISTYDLLMCFAYALVIIGISILIGPKFNKYLAFVLVGIYTLYMVAQSVYYRAFKQYFRFNTALGLSKEAIDVKDSISEFIVFNDFIPFIVLIVITILFIVLYYILQRKIKYHYFFRLSSIIVLMLGISLIFININNIYKTKEHYTNFDIYKSEYYIYENVLNTNDFVKSMGLNTLLYRDSLSLFKKEHHLDYSSEINDYYKTNSRQLKENEFSGIFKDKSVLLIQAESLMMSAISEELTPNLYYYMHSGINFTNFNTPILIGSTSDTEFMANTSIMPITDGYPVCYEYIENEYPLTLGNLFKENGYETYAYHNNYAEYYNRDIAFAKYGYDFYDSVKLGLENLEPDTKLAETIAYILSEKEKFIGYWITFSGHQPYNLNEVGVSLEDVKKVKELYPNLDDSNVAYIAKAMNLDQAVARFIDVMDWMGRLDDIVIVLFGDHSAKGLDMSKDSAYANTFGMNSDDDQEIIRTPLFIWANGIENKEIDTYATSLDIMPTITNMFAINDSKMKYLIGNDMMDVDNQGLTFNANGDFETRDFKYSANEDKVILKSNISESEARNIISKLLKEKEICAKILKSDYFNGK